MVHYTSRGEGELAWWLCIFDPDPFLKHCSVHVQSVEGKLCNSSSSQLTRPMYTHRTEYTTTYMYVQYMFLMRDEKEERKKQARSNKQTRQSNIAHPSTCIPSAVTILPRVSFNKLLLIIIGLPHLYRDPKLGSRPKLKLTRPFAARWPHLSSWVSWNTHTAV